MPTHGLVEPISGPPGARSHDDLLQILRPQQVLLPFCRRTEADGQGVGGSWRGLCHRHAVDEPPLRAHASRSARGLSRSC